MKSYYGKRSIFKYRTYRLSGLFAVDCFIFDEKYQDVATGKFSGVHCFYRLRVFTANFLASHYHQCVYYGCKCVLFVLQESGLKFYLSHFFSLGHLTGYKPNDVWAINLLLDKLLKANNGAQCSS
jgi:hypothetical protein